MRLARHFAAERIEAREDDRARRVVDDQLHAGRGLERADVAAFAPDDPSLQVVARQVDDRDGGLDRVLGGAALDGVGDDHLRAGGGGLARLGLEPLDHVRGVVAGDPFDLLEEQLAGLVGAQPGDALQLALAVGGELFDARGGGGGALLVRREGLFAPAEVLLQPVGGREAIREGPRLVGQPLFEPDNLLAALARLAFAFRGELVRFLTGFEGRFLAEALGVALGLLEHALALGVGVLENLGGCPATGRRPPEECPGRKHACDDAGDGGQAIRCPHRKIPRNLTLPGQGVSWSGVQKLRRLRKGPALPCGEVG